MRLTDNGDTLYTQYQCDHFHPHNMIIWIEYVYMKTKQWLTDKPLFIKLNFLYRWCCAIIVYGYGSIGAGRKTLLFVDYFITILLINCYMVVVVVTLCFKNSLQAWRCWCHRSVSSISFDRYFIYQLICWNVIIMPV